MAQHDILRISREVASIQNGIDLSLAVAHEESDMRRVTALIIGPPNTPYAYGFFEFDVKFPPEYPAQPPQVQAKTTNRGQVRFNPNIYAEGKVCLSILGTWSGRGDEKWSPAQNLESVLISIQSLMSDDPYANEPGYENKNDDDDKELREAYCAKIQHETIRIAVIQPLESLLRIRPDGSSIPTVTFETLSLCSSERRSENENEAAEGFNAVTETLQVRGGPFADLKKRRFLWYFESYRAVIGENMARFPNGTRFTDMPFENVQNGMMGNFEYEKLNDRLTRIKELVDLETQGWLEEGSKAVKQELCSAHTMQTALMEFRAYQKQKGLHSVDVNFLDGNPFVWIITYFGRSGTNLEGGVFRIRLSLSPRFPEEQPRVRVETKIYHHRVARDGVLCYFPTKIHDIKHHVEAVVFALEEISPPYDPRAIVNMEATRLLWGDENDKKKYERAQRRSAQASIEDLEG